MELIAAILFAGPLGCFCRSRKLGLWLYLLLWLIILPVQTTNVHAGNPDDLGVSYVVLNAVILATGVGLNALGAHLRERRGRGATDPARIGA